MFNQDLFFFPLSFSYTGIWVLYYVMGNAPGEDTCFLWIREWDNYVLFKKYLKIPLNFSTVVSCSFSPLFMQGRGGKWIACRTKAGLNLISLGWRNTCSKGDVWKGRERGKALHIRRRAEQRQSNTGFRCFLDCSLNSAVVCWYSSPAWKCLQIESLKRMRECKIFFIDLSFCFQNYCCLQCTFLYSGYLIFICTCGD